MSEKGNIIRCASAVVIIGLAGLSATTFYGRWKDFGQVVSADARTSAYLEKYSEPDCRFEGTWHDWARDEWMTLGCLNVKSRYRQGSYSSATGPRATVQVALKGTYSFDGEGFIHFAGQDSEGKNHDFSAPISVENGDYPTQLCLAETTEGIACIAFFIWKNDE